MGGLGGGRLAICIVESREFNIAKESYSKVSNACRDPTHPWGGHPKKVSLEALHSSCTFMSRLPHLPLTFQHSIIRLAGTASTVGSDGRQTRRAL